MAFAAGLRESLRLRDDRVHSELDEGFSLTQVLDRHLLAIERMSETELITSVLLLSSDGKRLSHGAGPNLPPSYRAAVDGSQIGPSAGSCGTAAYFGRPVYVTDIATDPLWQDYRHLALPHGLRSCWSTPIRSPDGSVIGTFAIYHRTVSDPTPDEIKAIEMITDHVAAAIIWSANAQDFARRQSQQSRRPQLRLVRDVDIPPASDHPSLDRLLGYMETLESKAAELDRGADKALSGDEARLMRAIADACRRLTDAIRLQIELHDRPKP